MNNTLTVNLDSKQEIRLSRLALRFGLSLPEFSRQVLLELSATFPTESFQEYKNPKGLKASLNRALKDFQTGKIHKSL